MRTKRIVQWQACMGSEHVCCDKDNELHAHVCASGSKYERGNHNAIATEREERCCTGLMHGQMQVHDMTDVSITTFDVQR